MEKRTKLVQASTSSKQDNDVDELKIKNSKYVEELFDRSIKDINKSFNELKNDINKLTFDIVISKTNSNNNLKKRKSSSSFNLSRVGNLNKEARLKSFLLNTHNNDKTSCWPKLPPIYTDQEKLLFGNKEIIQLKPVLNQVKSELDDNNMPIVTLTWNVINNTNNDNLIKNIKEYEIFSYKESINNNQDKDIEEIQDWTIIGTIEPYKPPVKCTLADFSIGHCYWFSIRIKDLNNLKSNFSDPVSVNL